MHKSRRQKNEKKGLFAEYFCIFYMRLLGYRKLQHRLQTPFGEIDLIFKKSDILVFCEVKYRNNPEALLYCLTEQQKIRIKRAAEYWLAQNELDQYHVRFDFIGLTYMHKPLHIKDAF